MHNEIIFHISFIISQNITPTTLFIQVHTTMYSYTLDKSSVKVTSSFKMSSVPTAVIQV